jgi:hypothetical protein
MAACVSLLAMAAAAWVGWDAGRRSLAEAAGPPGKPTFLPGVGRDRAPASEKAGRIKPPIPKGAEVDGPPPPRPSRPVPPVEVQELRCAMDDLIGVGLRHAHQAIGLIADGAEGELYTIPMADSMLDTVLTRLDAADKAITKLPDGAFEDRGEQWYSGRMREAIRLLRAETRLLRAHLAGKTPKSADALRKAREASAEAIGKLPPGGP